MYSVRKQQQGTPLEMQETDHHKRTRSSMGVRAGGKAEIFATCKQKSPENIDFALTLGEWGRSTTLPIHSTTYYLANGPVPCNYVYSTKKNRVNRNEASLLDEQLRFGSASSLTFVNGLIPPINELFIFEQSLVREFSQNTFDFFDCFACVTTVH